MESDMTPVFGFTVVCLQDAEGRRHYQTRPVDIEGGETLFFGDLEDHLAAFAVMQAKATAHLTSLFVRQAFVDAAQSDTGLVSLDGRPVKSRKDYVKSGRSRR